MRRLRICKATHNYRSVPEFKNNKHHEQVQNRKNTLSTFSGKTVLITGAAGGIGQALAQHFGSLGAKIAVLDRDPSVNDFVGELDRVGVTAAAAIADIGSDSEIRLAFEALREQLGPIAILINNAGAVSANTLQSSNSENWQTDISVNLNGAYSCSRCALEDMVVQKAGAIIHISSVNGLLALGDPAYSAAKAGMISHARALAMEYGRYGIRANVICPGTVRTPIWKDRVAEDPNVIDNLLKWYPLRRIADPIDIAKAAAFLASDDAAAITGAVLPVDCGLTAGNIVMARELTLREF